MVVSEILREPPAGAALAGQATLLEALQAEISERLAVLDDVAVTGTGQSSAEVLGVSGGGLAQTLAGHLMREIMVRGSGGGPLAPLADQLNHDVTHLQGQRLEGMLAQLAGQVQVLAAAANAPVASRPVRLLVFDNAPDRAAVEAFLWAGSGPPPSLVPPVRRSPKQIFRKSLSETQHMRSGGGLRHPRPLRSAAA